MNSFIGLFLLHRHRVFTRRCQTIEARGGGHCRRSLPKHLAARPLVPRLATAYATALTAIRLCHDWGQPAPIPRDSVFPALVGFVVMLHVLIKPNHSIQEPALVQVG